MIFDKAIAFGVIIALPAMWLSCSVDKQSKEQKEEPVLQREYIDCELLHGLVTTNQDDTLKLSEQESN